RGEDERREHEPRHVAELAGEPRRRAAHRAGLPHPVVEHQHDERAEAHGVQDLADRPAWSSATEHATQARHPYTLPPVSEPDKPSDASDPAAGASPPGKQPTEGAQQLAAAEAEAKARFEK